MTIATFVVMIVSTVVIIVPAMIVTMTFAITRCEVVAIPAVLNEVNLATASVVSVTVTLPVFIMTWWNA